MNAITKIDGHIRYCADLAQGSPDWLAARCGLLTASEMKLILTPTLKTADNEKTRAHLWELLAQRITGHVEPQYVSDAMVRGQVDEVYARLLYSEKYAEVDEVGFIMNDEWGFKLGYSPDGLVGDDGLIEIKSRCQKYQVQTLAEAEIPAEYMLQVQTGLLVTKRKWCDFVSYCGGLPMVAIRVYPILEIQTAIIGAAAAFEAKLAVKMEDYHRTITSGAIRTIPTERKIIQEIF